MLQDVSGEMLDPDLLTFDAYIDNVSCSIGRLLIPILSLEEAPYRKISHHAGIAIQLTNTQRDIDENLTLGFLCLSRKLLRSQGILCADIFEIRHHPDINRVLSALARQASEHYQQAESPIGTGDEPGAVVMVEMVSCYKRLLANVCQERGLYLR